MAAQTIYDKQKSIISKLKERMKDADLPIREYFKQSENESDTISVFFDEVGISKSEICGQILFQPETMEEPGIMNGMIYYILADDLDPSAAINMKYAVNHVNARLPMGGFYLDSTDKVLTYRQTFTVYEDEHEEQIAEMFLMHFSIGFAFVQQWLDAFVGLNAGLFTLDEFLQFGR